ncbi:MAG TPA: hypothetical protein VFH76_21980 [Kribbella sp.]|nr:hypothetical protein [Kribbella sp.]
MALSESELDTGALTTNPMVIVALTFVPLARTVIGADPVGVVAEVRTVSAVLAVLPELSVAEVGLNDAEAPPGTPVALNATVPLNPPTDVTLMVYVAA